MCSSIGKAIPDWNNLPLELLLEIFKYVDKGKTLSNCSLTCHTWRNLVLHCDTILWKPICIHDWSTSVIEVLDPMVIDYVDSIDNLDSESNSHSRSMLTQKDRTVSDAILCSTHSWRRAWIQNGQSKECVSKAIQLVLESHDQDSISLQNMNLPALPSLLFTMATHITQLNLEGNGIVVLPPEIGLLTNLQSLHLQNNRLKRLPNELSCLVNLQILDLTNNLLEELPAELAALQKLQIISLSRNHFKTFSNSPLCEWTNLITLALDNNKLSSLPEHFGNLVNLRHLFLNDNLVTFADFQFTGLTRLQIKYIF